MSKAAGRCPACCERLLRRQGTGLMVKNRFLLLESGDRPRIVIGCPKCKGELEVLKGRLLLLRRLHPVPASGSTEQGTPVPE